MSRSASPCKRQLNQTPLARWPARRKKRSMWLRSVGVAVLSACLCGTTIGQTAEMAAWQCPGMKPVERCFKRHGRLSSQNGIALKIWLTGTTRVVALDNEFGRLPTTVREYLEMTSPKHSYVYGDFDICPLEPDKPGQMRRVCVVGAEKLVVQDVQGLRPPFRLLSTWSTGGQAEPGQK